MKHYFDLKVKNKKSDVTGISNDKRRNLKYKKYLFAERVIN